MVKHHVRKGWLWSRRNPITLALVVAASVTWLTLEDTRDDVAVTERIVNQSPCTAKPESPACQTVKRQADKARSVTDTCIAFRRVGYQCPVGEVKEEVVQQQGSSPSQRSGPVEGPSSNEPPVTEQPDGGNNPSEPPAPNPQPVTPPPVTPPSPQKPLIDLRPVTEPVCSVTRPIAAIC